MIASNNMGDAIKGGKECSFPDQSLWCPMHMVIQAARLDVKEINNQHHYYHYHHQVGHS